MFKWASTPLMQFKLEAEIASLADFQDTLFSNERWDDEWLQQDSTDTYKDNIPSANELRNQATSLSSLGNHELLSAEDEKKLAFDLRKSFGYLQGKIALEDSGLDLLHRLVIENQNDIPDKLLDQFLTLHDTLLVYHYLVLRDSRFEAEYQQIRLIIEGLCAQVALDRDEVLGFAENKADLYQQELSRIYYFRNRFITSNVRLVYHVARRHLDKGMTLDDMVQEGVLGLLRAATKFNPDVGVRFSTYSFWWIKQAIRQAIAKQRSLIRYPTHVTDQVNRLYAYKRIHQSKHGVYPSVSQIKESLAIPEKKIKSLENLTNFCVSASAPLYQDSERNLQDEMEYDEPFAIPEEVQQAADNKKQLLRYFELLNEREIKVLSLRYGIGHSRSYSLNEVAPQINVSRERVRQIAEEALTKIRQSINS